MALCPICRHELPATTVGRCPWCGADLALSPPLPEDAGAGTPPPAGLPPVGLPPGGSGWVPPGQGGPGIPWQERDRVGLLTALVDTTKLVLTSPGAFFRAMPLSGGLGSPLLYAVIVGWVGLVAASLYNAIFRSVVGSSLAGLGDRPEFATMLSWMEGWAGFVGQVVFGGLFVVIGVFIGAGIVHLMLLLLGGARYGFEATFRVVSFSQATSVLFLVPFCGQMIGAIWTIVLYIIGVAEAHRIGYGKAAAAVLLPFVLLCCCCVLFAAIFAGTLAGIAGRTR